jgi:hypothetical protein
VFYNFCGFLGFFNKILGNLRYFTPKIFWRHEKKTHIYWDHRITLENFNILADFCIFSVLWASYHSNLILSKNLSKCVFSFRVFRKKNRICPGNWSETRSLSAGNKTRRWYTQFKLIIW